MYHDEDVDWIAAAAGAVLAVAAAAVGATAVVDVVSAEPFDMCSHRLSDALDAVQTCSLAAHCHRWDQRTHCLRSPLQNCY